MQFKDVVTDPAQFRELMGEPPPPCVAKTIASLPSLTLVAISEAEAALPKTSLASFAINGDVSNVPFRLEPPLLTVTAPSTVTVGSATQVKWTHNLGQLEAVDVALSRDGGATWTAIATRTLHRRFWISCGCTVRRFHVLGFPAVVPPTASMFLDFLGFQLLLRFAFQIARVSA